MIAAIVPAAGRSLRMGQPKLLLQLGGDTVIGRVVTALRAGGAGRVAVVAPPDDTPEGPAIAAAAVRAGAEVVTPLVRPAEMRDSIELGLALFAGRPTPEWVVITPGDSPGITAAVVAQLLAEAARRPDCIVVPQCDGRRGHPIVLPWSIAGDIALLPSGRGLNQLIKRHDARIAELPLGDVNLVSDLDTPDDLRRWQMREEMTAPPPGPAATMRLCVRLFALAKERAGRSEIDLELASPSRVADLRTALAVRLPALAPLLPMALIAVNEEYAADEDVIVAGATIAVIPPVSGGAGMFASTFVACRRRRRRFPP
jgi:molybdenum cofactor cytidylyltransferase